MRFSIVAATVELCGTEAESSQGGYCLFHSVISRSRNNHCVIGSFSRDNGIINLVRLHHEI